MISRLHEFHFSLLGKDISPLQSARDLGVTLDSNLTFDNHITTIVSECIARLAQINRFKDCLDKKYIVNRNTCLSLQQNVLLFECLGKYHK